MKLTNTLERCPNCNNLFFHLLNSRAVIHLTLNETESIYTYCSEKCLEEKLSNINSKSNILDPYLVIKNKARIAAEGNNPVIWRVDLDIKYPELEIKNVS